MYVTLPYFTSFAIILFLFAQDFAKHTLNSERNKSMNCLKLLLSRFKHNLCICRETTQENSKEGKLENNLIYRK